ncbi:hypothetical protein BDV96DRAFT_649847 [Lophiotrema nucula]|uniref:Uncharacterized protein n=1 Tax=Lophiotrema nucula TaxID=690887 RepID=A0A6A5YXH3_9PLEO|nr:hypothetical protein BDV96DRAFT_649847 [Lophiotrema nucula]
MAIQRQGRPRSPSLDSDDFPEDRIQDLRDRAADMLGIKSDEVGEKPPYFYVYDPPKNNGNKNPAPPQRSRPRSRSPLDSHSRSDSRSRESSYTPARGRSPSQRGRSGGFDSYRPVEWEPDLVATPPRSYSRSYTPARSYSPYRDRSTPPRSPSRERSPYREGRVRHYDTYRPPRSKFDKTYSPAVLSDFVRHQRSELVKASPPPSTACDLTKYLAIIVNLHIAFINGDGKVNPSHYGSTLLADLGLCYTTFWTARICEHGILCPWRHHPLTEEEKEWIANVLKRFHWLQRVEKTMARKPTPEPSYRLGAWLIEEGVVDLEATVRKTTEGENMNIAEDNGHEDKNLEDQNVEDKIMVGKNLEVNSPESNNFKDKVIKNSDQGNRHGSHESRRDDFRIRGRGQRKYYHDNGFGRADYWDGGVRDRFYHPQNRSRSPSRGYDNNVRKRF